MPGRRSVLRRQREEVEKEFECPICQETDRELRIFPACQHFACTECVGRLMASAQRDRDDRYRQGFDCPICRANIEVPAGGLPVHRLVENIRERHRIQKQEIEQVYEDITIVRPVIVDEPRRDVPQVIAEADAEEVINNAVNIIEERRKQQVETACNHLIENDDRCDGKCHISCVNCGKQMLEFTNEAFCDAGGRSCSGSKRAFLLPCWVFVLMQTSKPCIGVFRQKDLILQEKKIYKPLRDRAWEIMLSSQKVAFPYWFQVSWSFWLIVMFAACVGINIYDIVSDRNLVTSCIACGLDGICLVLWIVFSVINLTLYKQPSAHEIKGESLRFSYFFMQQIQQYLSELCVYPQLCMSCLTIWRNYNTVSSFPFYACGISLLIVFAIRIHTVVCIRWYIHVFFVRLLLFMAGCVLVVILWLVSLTSSADSDVSTPYHYDGMLPYQILLSVFIFSNNTVNMAMFYLSHLYEVTLQSGITIMKLDPPQFHQCQQEITRLTQDNQSFYKNMYPMGSACYGTLLFFWLFPVGAVTTTGFVTAVFSYGYWSDEETVLFAILGIASMTNLIINAKTLLLSCSGHFTMCVLVGLLVLCCIASAFFVAIIYAPIIFIAVLVCVCVCFCNSDDE